MIKSFWFFTIFASPLIHYIHTEIWSILFGFIQVSLRPTAEQGF